MCIVRLSMTAATLSLLLSSAVLRAQWGVLSACNTAGPSATAPRKSGVVRGLFFSVFGDPAQ